MAIGEDYEAADALEDIAEMIDVMTKTETIGSSMMEALPQLTELSQWLRDALGFVNKLEKGGIADLML